ncbi:putative Gp44 domain protein [Yersinia aldovae 670-83]|nr:putative Gp44 domain protein [Yersinia aldovae 670-83]
MSSFRDLVKKLQDDSRTTVDLIAFKKDRDSQTSESRYFVKHAAKTILEQEMVIHGNVHGYTAEAVITEFPHMETEKAAALKLADWLKRMALAIEGHYSEPEEEADDNRQAKE